MIGTIRKHQQWLWFVIIAAIIISFVWYFSPDAKWKGLWTARDNRYQVNGKPVTINGQPITQEEFADAYRETILGSFMRTGGREWPANDEQTHKNLERDAIFRVFLLQKMKEFDISVSDSAVAQAARERLGNFPLANFEKEYLFPHGLTEQDFERYLHNDLSIQQLISAAAVSGKLFSPAEGEILFRKEHEKSETKLAVFWKSNFMAQVNVTPEALATYYTNRMVDYRLPERVIVSYVEFPSTNFLADAEKQISQITNLTAEIDSQYYKAGTNAFKSTNGLPLPEAEAKKQIRQELVLRQAMFEARRKANEIGNTLYNMDPQKAENLDQEAKKANLTVKISPPLERRPPAEEEGPFPQTFRDEAFKLSIATPVGFTPILGENSIYLVALKQKLPSEAQPLEKVKDKATADYRNYRALELARTAGMSFYTAATNGIAQKKSFEQICKEANVKVIAPEPFSQSTTALTNLDERLNLRSMQQLAESLKPGQVSQYLPTPMMAPEGGFVLYLQGKLPVTEAEVKKDLPEFLGRLRAYRQSEAFNQWFRKQAEQSKLYIPPPKEPTSIGS